MVDLIIYGAIGALLIVAFVLGYGFGSYWLSFAVKDRSENPNSSAFYRNAGGALPELYIYTEFVNQIEAAKIQLSVRNPAYMALNRVLCSISLDDCRTENLATTAPFGKSGPSKCEAADHKR